MCREFDLFQRSRRWWDHPEKTNLRNTNAAAILHPFVYSIFFSNKEEVYCKVYTREYHSHAGRCLASKRYVGYLLYDHSCTSFQSAALICLSPACQLDLYSTEGQCPSLKASCKTQTSFHYPLWGQIFDFGCYSIRDSFFFLLDLLTSRVILQLVLSVQPSFLCIPLFIQRCILQRFRWTGLWTVQRHRNY